jgi:hypothetical protein
MKERIRESIDLPEKIAIGIGAGGLVLSLFYLPAFAPAMELIIGGGTSLGITNAVWPRKQTTA